MDQDLAKNAISNIHRDNLNKRQRSTLKALSKRTDIIIRESDKGDTIVVETIDRYISDGLSHLSDEEVHHRLSTDITIKTHNAIASFLEHCFERGLINHHIYQFLKSTKQPDTPIIYFF